MFKKNKKLMPSQPYTPPQSYSGASEGTQGDGDFTKSYVPEDEGSGYMLGYLSIVFGLLFNVIGMVLGVLSIIKGIKKQKIVLSLLGVTGVAASVFGVWMYVQAFQFLLPGVTYDGNEGRWVVQQEEAAIGELQLEEYRITSPNGAEFGLSLPAGMNTTNDEDDDAFDFAVTEASQLDVVGDFKATVFFFSQFEEVLSSGELQALTDDVIAQNMSNVEDASFSLLRETHAGIVPDTIEVVAPTSRVELEHSYFNEVLVFEVVFDRLLDRQAVPTEAHVWLLYNTEQIMALLLSTPEQSQLGLRQFGLEAVGSFTPIE